MLQEGTDVGRHDDQDRGADAKLQAHIRRHSKRTEHLIEDRHDDAAAPDAEQAGKNPRHHPAREDQQHEPGKLVERNTKGH
jgi:hypothetical protein